jgi:hypothetical protein
MMRLPSTEGVVVVMICVDMRVSDRGQVLRSDLACSVCSQARSLRKT